MRYTRAGGGGGAQRGHAVLPPPPCQRPPPRRRGSPPLRPARGRAGARWRTRAAGGGRAWPGRACHGRVASSRRRQAGDAPTVARASRRTPHRVGGTPPPCRCDVGAARRPVAAADIARRVSASAAARQASGPCAEPRTHAGPCAEPRTHAGPCAEPRTHAGACRSAHGRWSAAPRPRASVRTPTTDAVNGALGRRPRGARYTRAPSAPRGARSQAVWSPAPPPAPRPWRLTAAGTAVWRGDCPPTPQSGGRRTQPKGGRGHPRCGDMRRRWRPPWVRRPWSAASSQRALACESPARLLPSTPRAPAPSPGGGGGSDARRACADARGHAGVRSSPRRLPGAGPLPLPAPLCPPPLVTVGCTRTAGTWGAPPIAKAVLRTVGAPQRVAGRTPATPPWAVRATGSGDGTGRPCRSPRAPSLGTRPSPAVGPSLAAVEAGVGEMPRPCASACPAGRAAPAHRWGVRRCGPSMGETAWRWHCRHGRPLCGDWGWGWGEGGVKRRCEGRFLNCEEKNQNRKKAYARWKKHSSTKDAHATKAIVR